MKSSNTNLRAEAVSLLERATRLKAKASFLAGDDAEHGTAEARGPIDLVARDHLRHELVQEWKQLSAEAERMEEALSCHRDSKQGFQRSVQEAVVAVKVLEEPVKQHLKLATAFPLPGTADAHGQGTDRLPHQQADAFVEEFGQTTILPAARARNRWKQLASDLQLNSAFRTAVSAGDEAEVAAAEGKSIEASARLRQQYNEWIPLLRFGFPELRGKIKSLIDDHCGMGALRMDVSTEDFVMTDISVAGAGARVSRAITKSEACRTKSLKQEYCIKRFTNVDEFHRELEAMRVVNRDGMRDPNIGEVEFAFEEGVGGNRICFIAMPLYPMTSQKWFNAHGSSPSPAALSAIIRVLSEIVSGLACLHSHGILHGDLKPDNIMMDGTGLDARPKLIDFNFSTIQVSGATNALRIVTAPVAITPDFAPPEFFETPPRQRSRESDIYSLGKTFHVLLNDRVCSADREEKVISQWLRQLIAVMTPFSPESRSPLNQSTGGLERSATVADRLKACALMASLKPSAEGSPEAKGGAKMPQHFFAALKRNLTHGFEWWGLGYIMEPRQTVNVAGQQYTQRQCYVEALKQQYYVQVLKHDPKNSAAWNSLGVSLEATEQVQVNGADYNQVQCFEEALKHDPNNIDAWNNLGNCLDASQLAQVTGSSFTKRQCFVEALRHDPKSSYAWHGLGVALNAREVVQVNGSNYTKRQCFVEALRHDPKSFYAWNSLGSCMKSFDETTVNGTRYSKRECFVQGLKYDRKNSQIWNSLGSCMKEKHDEVKVNGTTYTNRQCFVEALRLDPGNTFVWNSLGACLEKDEVVEVNGSKFSKRKCCLKGLAKDPTGSFLWHSLGKSLDEGDEVEVNGEKYNARQCYLTSLKYKPTNSFAWNTLGCSLSGGEQVKVNGVHYNQQQCFVEGLKHEPSSITLWSSLGVRMGADDRVWVKGAEYAKRQCFLEVLEHDATNGFAWKCLEADMKASDEVTVNRIKYTKRQCAQEAQKHQKNN